jgi:hypothetical protein
MQFDAPTCFASGDPLKLVPVKTTGQIVALIVQDVPEILRDAVCWSVKAEDEAAARRWLNERR